MREFYCNFSRPSIRLGMYINASRALNTLVYPAVTVDDFARLIANYKPEYVMFQVGLEFPQRPVDVNHPKLMAHIKRMIKAWNDPRLTSLQYNQLDFLSKQPQPATPPATPVYHVACHTCQDNAHFHGTVGARAYIEDHAGHKTWLSWDDERVDGEAASERDAAWADEATREQAAQDAIADQAEADFQAWVADGEIAAAESFDVNEQELDRELEIGIFSE